jgi:hypothetical protein
MSYDAPSVHYGHEMIDEGIRIADPFSRSGVGKHINMTCISTRGKGKFYFVLNTTHVSVEI